MAMAFILSSPGSPDGTTAAAAEVQPGHRVIVCYFHRTVRCPTCRKISAYVEEATKAGFPKETKTGRVRMVMMDYQDPKSRKYARAYRVSGPTLVIMNVHDGKVAAWKPAPKVWSLVGKKDAFLKYVQREIMSYLEENRTAKR